MNWIMRKLFGRNYITHECQQANHDICPGACWHCDMPCTCPCHERPDGNPVEVA